MTQQELNRAVARRTGENIATIEKMGFTPLTPKPAEHEPDDLTVDWDDLDVDRRVSPFSRRRPRPAVA